MVIFLCERVSGQIDTFYSIIMGSSVDLMKRKTCDIFGYHI